MAFVVVMVVPMMMVAPANAMERIDFVNHDKHRCITQPTLEVLEDRGVGQPDQTVFNRVERADNLVAVVGENVHFRAFAMV
ncbi:hypothetical protein [Alicyclobacillus suci]|uniref:hypothetical protein n=1 Tax=Alicyclobacillus suci TaxID=2816080 RepID=UPI001A8C4DE6|nr:hypothetical protein [Alicyclobacillus suci]